MVATFRIGCTSDRLWNLIDLLRFLHANKGGDILLNIDPEAICLTTLGLYDILDCFEFNSVQIFTSNPFEHHSKYQIKRAGLTNWLDRARPVQADLHQWNKKKIFLCLYGRPTAGRLGLAAHLHQKHSEISHIHFSTGTSADEIIQFELDKLLSWDVDSVEALGQIIKKFPLLLSDRSKYSAFHGYDYTDSLSNLYRDVLVDVVVESHVIGNTFFPTEKLVRSMLMKKPFILFGSKNFLDYLHQMGFRTFADFWSENYDGYEGKERLLRIKSLLDQISNIDVNTLESMYLDMTYTLDHNYNLLLNKKYSAMLQPIS